MFVVLLITAMFSLFFPRLRWFFCLLCLFYVKWLFSFFSFLCFLGAFLVLVCAYRLCLLSCTRCYFCSYTAIAISPDRVDKLSLKRNRYYFQEDHDLLRDCFASLYNYVQWDKRQLNKRLAGKGGRAAVKKGEEERESSDSEGSSSSEDEEREKEEELSRMLRE